MVRPIAVVPLMQGVRLRLSYGLCSRTPMAAGVGRYVLRVGRCAPAQAFGGRYWPALGSEAGGLASDRAPACRRQHPDCLAPGDLYGAERSSRPLSGRATPAAAG